MTDEDRLKQMLGLVGETGGARACDSCRWRGWFNGQFASCHAPIMLLHYDRDPPIIGSKQLRKERGLCGPNGLLWERRYWWWFIRLRNLITLISERPSE